LGHDDSRTATDPGAGDQRRIELVADERDVAELGDPHGTHLAILSAGHPAQ
jgi:hypothetical protein